MPGFRIPQSVTVDIKKKSLKVISVKQRVQYLKLLFKWKGGVWNLLWIDFIWFLGAHILVTILYQFVIIKYDNHRKNFESFLTYINQLRNLVPLSFLLGFFVTAVLSRWWSVAMSIPWLAKSSFIFQSLIGTNFEDKTPRKLEEHEREMAFHKIRKSILRYLNMAWIFTFVNFSLSIRQRFSIRKSTKSTTMKKVTGGLININKDQRVSIRERMKAMNKDPIIVTYYGKGSNFILEEEIDILEKMESELPTDKTLALDYWIPLQWALRTAQRAYEHGYIANHRLYLEVVNVINEYRGQLGTMYVYNDWKMPLVYIQVVIFVVYSFLFTEIFTQQIIKAEDPNLRRFHFQTYFPLMTILKYFLYMGWFQIGLCLMYPFAGNNIDMPLNDVLDFNILISTQGCKTTPDVFPVFLRESFGNASQQLDRLIGSVVDVPNQILEEVQGEPDGDDRPKPEKPCDPETIPLSQMA